ncbi:hypothetical protein [Glaciecola sp. KUL10]|uniref:hypothetical protein n=1 Tax=Glaciecola sp. (strain KUL10) TaxID=2161813 RepID=UPI000D783F3C|nr:hypothetical protein [Glaciecola sp. KUL10]
MKYCFILFLLICTAPLSFAAKTTVLGLGAIVDNDVANARQSAIEDAKRLAVEQLLGSFIQARTKTENFMLASEQVFSSSTGRIDKFDIIEEGKLDDATYQVKLIAYVNSEAITKDALALINNNQWSKKPRVKIKYSPQSNTASKQAKGHFHQAISASLRKEGFLIVEGQSNLDASFELHVTVIGDQQASEFQGMQIQTNLLNVDGVLLNSYTKDELSSFAFSNKKAGSPSSAYRSLAKELGKRAAQKLTLDTKVVWLSKLETPVTLSFKSVNPAQIKKIESNLQEAVIGLSALKTESQINNNYEFSASYAGWPEQLYDQLTQLSIRDDIAFNVVGFKQANLQLAVK